MKIRDRIKELRRVPARDLIPNERNWRKHPKAQQEALQGILAEIGYADALIVYETTSGLKLIDGHLRASTTPDTLVPVLVLDVTESEANKLLASLDPMAAMAQTDKQALDVLLRDVQTGSQALAGMLSELAEDAGVIPPEDKKAELAEALSDRYNQSTAGPTYQVKGSKPRLNDLFDTGKTEELINEIKSAGLPADIAAFLTAAAHRHTVFNYSAIAEYYCHAPANLQALMEASALVIIDFDQAIERGFVQLTVRLGKLADQELEAADAE